MNEANPAIKMVARNPHTRIKDEVQPEDGVAIERMTPLFWSNACGYVTIPGYEAADVYDAWLAGFAAAQ